MSAAIVLTGACLAAYPLISNHLYEKRQKELVKAYDQQAEDMTRKKRKEELGRAHAYNQALRDSNVVLSDPFDPEALADGDGGLYEDLLNVGDDGIIGHLEIPVLDLSLSVYHGTGTRALEAGVGHLENSSLPVGGAGTHAVLSAHTGTPGKKLFTDLELLEKGDIFLIEVLGETLAYEVDQIKVVRPENVSDLRIQGEQDYVTLVTCTPYGVNSHRLLVRGTRVPYEEAGKTAERAGKRGGSPWMRMYFMGVFGGTALLLLLLICYWFYRLRRDRSERQH